MKHKLLELRTEHNETQEQLAKVIGLKTAGLYCKRELGYIPVTLQEAYKLAVHYGKTIEEIFFTD